MRNDASLATDKELKLKAWNKLVAVLNAKQHRILDKATSSLVSEALCQSSYANAHLPSRETARAGGLRI
ncbi:hypothetical protein PHYPSEUDO_004565 [Phytophthora pseudosyringae]|uniref:Uncharacterized protein n=1 Tax=Phytophthora pseudosyringae TaxID=221518 RepID=A0A8T1WE52_9STRA|nr:hypothetical protein PHYPSEUDO_004565 [Phytophthora pseudosyringae]